ncbi:glutamine--fructose-6-phosphate transaminase (isomerizing) [Candidatus Kaiserbacteria bacterium]|nr:glutamine--fructose-6-phosphate transaminase (isomerizing) [Candidatus Kaiserbacteria bacterium]
MCGIVGYIGKKPAVEMLINGLKALEYRGYDSAGLYISGEQCVRSIGGVDNLYKKLPKGISGTAGIAHTRWATHGKPSEENAHPHSSPSGSIFVVHNGIVENYIDLKNALEEQGSVFSSKTDSEVIAHLIEKQIKDGDTFEESVVNTLKIIKGSYGIAVMNTQEPEKIIAAQNGSPIVLGIGNDEYFIASDVSAIVKHTKTVLYVKDGECVVITPTSHNIFTINLKPLNRKTEEVVWNTEQVKKGGYKHFMLKEIMEAPEVLKNSARGRTLRETGDVKLGGLEEIADKLTHTKRIVIVGCGSAYYAGMLGKQYFEEIAGIPTEVEIASEYRYRTILQNKGTVVLAISQSGETADTLSCINEANNKGCLTIGVVNVVGSSIARAVDAGVYNHAGPEIGVASTKAFLSQLEVLLLIALYIGRKKNISSSEGKIIIDEINKLPQKITRVLAQNKKIERIAKKYAHSKNFLYIGRKYSYPIALEGALKLKEVSYIHAEGYGAGEMKHGPIAMIDESFPTIALIPSDSVYEKTFSNIEEIRARDGKVIAIATQGDKKISAIANDVLEIPQSLELIHPILTTVLLQLFAYHIGVHRGHNVDRPRNLAKSVTVE